MSNERYFTAVSTEPVEDGPDSIAGCPTHTVFGSLNKDVRAMLQTSDAIELPPDCRESTTRKLFVAYDQLSLDHSQSVHVLDGTYLPTAIARKVWFEAIRLFEEQIEHTGDKQVVATGRRIAHELGWGWYEDDEPECETVKEQMKELEV